MANVNIYNSFDEKLFKPILIIKTKTMKTKLRNYSWCYGSHNEILIYEQKKEDENTYNCISQIVQQLKQENKNFIFNLST